VLRGYERSWVRPDLVAGITVGAMLVPQAMGYAELAGLPPQVGFYAAIAPLLVYAVVGSSRHLGVGPEPGTAVLAATGVASIMADRPGAAPSDVLELMSALALVVAAIAILGWVLRLGDLANVLSKPVLVGYITGVGTTLLTSQLGAATGVRITSDDAVGRMAQLGGRLGDVNGWTLALTLGSLALMLGVKRVAPTLPAALTGVAIATAISWAASLGERGVRLVGSLPSGLPVPSVPELPLADWSALVPLAAGIVLVGFTDNVLTARSLATRTGDRIDPNQELLALGLINAASGVSQGFPISSSASRTAVPASLGSRSQLVSIVAAAFVICALAFGGPLLAEIPRAALAAVIVSAAIAIIDVRGLASLRRVSRPEFLLALVTAGSVVVLGVLNGIAIAVVASVVMALSTIARPHDAILGSGPGLDGWVDVGHHPDAVTSPGLVVFRFDAPLFFINAERFAERITAAMDDNPGDEEWVVIDAEGIGALDASALDMLRELLDRLVARGVAVVAVARANERVLDRLARAGLLEPGGMIGVFPTINAAVRGFEERHG
jgi:high affinity sulfate transporter 1